MYRPKTWQILTSNAIVFFFSSYFIHFNRKAWVAVYRLLSRDSLWDLHLPWYDHFLTAGGSATCHILVEREEIKYRVLLLLQRKWLLRNILCELFYSLLLCPFILEIQMLAIQNKRDKNEFAKVEFVNFPLQLTWI